MGNCQAAEAATVVIQHPAPANKIERIYWSVTARHVMESNPGHYVALVINNNNNNNNNNGNTPFRQYKLLRPNDTLLIGQVYRLISFDEVLKEFAAKKCVKLGKLLMERGALGVHIKHPDSSSPHALPTSTSKMEREIHQMRSNGGNNKTSNNNKGSGKHFGGSQWRPALQSIAEFGT